MSAGSVNRESGQRYPWIRLALFDKKLIVIVDHLMSNCRYRLALCYFFWKHVIIEFVTDNFFYLLLFVDAQRRRISRVIH